MLCVTNDEDHLGWVSASAEVGGIVTVFQGDRLPFLLRPLGNGGHRLVGDCWIDVLMTKKSFESSTAPDQISEIV